MGWLPAAAALALSLGIAPAGLAAEALEVTGGRALLAAGASSADEVIGADVVGPTGDPVGTVDDLVLADDYRVEQVIVADGGLFGMAGKRVAIDFAGAVLTADDAGEDATLRINLPDQALDQAAEFDESRLEGGSDRLASAFLDRQVDLSAGKAEGEIEDLVIGPDGTVQYALIAFHGMFDAEDDLVVVDMDQIAAATPDAAVTLSMSEAQIRSAPRYAGRAGAAPPQ